MSLFSWSVESDSASALKSKKLRLGEEPLLAQKLDVKKLVFERTDFVFLLAEPLSGVCQVLSQAFLSCLSSRQQLVRIESSAR